MTSAGQELQEAVMTALERVAKLSGIYPGPPLTAAPPYAVVEAGAETDWSHKNGKGREVRLAVTVRDGGERPARVQAVGAAVDSVLETLSAQAGGWRVVSLQFLRSRIVREPKGPPPMASGPTWAVVIEYRARMLASDVQQSS